MTDSPKSSQGGEQGESQQAPWWHVEADGDIPNPADVGTAAQEAVKLAAAVAQWAEQAGLTETLKGIAEQAAVSVQTAARAATTPSTSRHEADEDVDVVFEAPGEPPHSQNAAEHDRTTCDNCPICQGVDFIKTVSPEAANGINDALAAVTTAIRQAVDGLTPAGDGSGTKVEHIDID